VTRHCAKEEQTLVSATKKRRAEVMKRRRVASRNSRSGARDRGFDVNQMPVAVWDSARVELTKLLAAWRSGDRRMASKRPPEEAAIAGRLRLLRCPARQRQVSSGTGTRKLQCKFRYGYTDTRLVTIPFRPCLDTQIHLQIPLCKKKIPRHIKMSAFTWSTKYR
jgi:hypothetical protein